MCQKIVAEKIETLLKMKKIITLVLLFFPLIVWGQITYINRWESETKGKEELFTLMPNSEGVLGFRMTPDKGFNLRYQLEFFRTDSNLSKSPILEIPMKDYHDLIGYDTDGENFYAFFTKSSSSEKYLIKINIETLNYTSIDLQTVLNMEYIEFLVSNDKAIFIGINDSRPIIQSFDLEDKTLYTFPEIHTKDMSILQVRKVPDYGLIEVITSSRKRFSKKQISFISYDEIGNKIRQITLDSVVNDDYELIEAIATPYQNLETSIVGTFGYQKKEYYLGNYIVKINEFGEQKIDYYELKDYPNFYKYLENKAYSRKQKELNKYYAKDLSPPIKPFLRTHQVIVNGPTQLIQNETYTVTQNRSSTRDGRYYNNFNRYNQPFAFQNNNQLDPGMLIRGPVSTFSVEREYKNIATHLAYIHEDGRVIWENSIKNPLKVSVDLTPKNQISFDGYKLYLLTLVDLQIAVSSIKNGEVIYQNQMLDYQLNNPNERLKEIKYGTLQLLHWYEHYFICSGIAQIRSLNKEGKEEIREVFFIDKILVTDELPVLESQFDK